MPLPSPPGDAQFLTDMFHKSKYGQVSLPILIASGQFLIDPSI